MKGIRLTRLFGHFDYTVNFSEKGLTILTGPNGFGKSTIIKCINAISNSELDFFFELDFEELEIIKDNPEENLILKKADSNIWINGRRVDRRTVIDGRRAFIRRNNKMLEISPQMLQMTEDYSYALRCMQGTIGKVFFIKEQRLLQEVSESKSVHGLAEARRIENRIVHTVQQIPEKMLKIIQAASAGYSQIANELDSTYPERLFHQKDGIEESEFDKKMQVMHEKVEKLNKYGISNINKLNDVRFNKEDARALKIYFEDFEKKYQVYEELIEKLEMLTRMVNDRFRFKTLRVSAEKGVEVVDNDDDKKVLELSRLSSGEQETLVLLYQLLFEVPDDVTLLVDEPEMSLHIAWQRMFVQDLEKITDKKNLCAIVATHSPQIVNGKQSIQVDLGELYKNGLNQGKYKT